VHEDKQHSDQVTTLAPQDRLDSNTTMTRRTTTATMMTTNSNSKEEHAGDNNKNDDDRSRMPKSTQKIFSRPIFWLRHPPLQRTSGIQLQTIIKILTVSRQVLCWL
jgi:hypothetical protein